MRLSWTVAIALFVAVKFFGAPPVTIAYVVAGELLFVSLIFRRHDRKRARSS